MSPDEPAEPSSASGSDGRPPEQLPPRVNPSDTASPTSADDADRTEENRAFTLAETAEKAGAAQQPQLDGRRERRKQRRTRIPMDTDLDREVAAQIAKNLKLEEKLSLRRLIAIFAIAAVSVQLVSASLLFWGYLANPTWREGTPPEVMLAWLSATVVEVIGIVVIIARNLFPSGEKPVTKSQVSKMLRSSESGKS